MPSNPLLSWDRLGHTFFRTLEGYTMLWDVDCTSALISAAPDGGAIAVTRNPTVLSEYRHTASLFNKVLVFSGSGRVLREIQLSTSDSVRGLGWSRHEHLILVFQSGSLRYYFDLDGNFQQISLGTMAESVGVIEAHFVNSGLVVRLANNRFLSVCYVAHESDSSFGQPMDFRVRPLAPVRPLPDGSEDTTVLTCIALPTHKFAPPDMAPELLLACDTGVYICDGQTARPRLPRLQAQGLAASPTGEMLAVSSDNVCGVYSSEFNEITTFHLPPTTEKIHFCGPDALVACVAHDELVLCDILQPSEKPLTLTFDSQVFVFAECDGMRLLTQSKDDFYCRVPDFVADIFRIGSVTPAAVLKDCVELLDTQSQKAQENLALINDDLPTAVEHCVAAAALEFEPSWQKLLLKAASLGKASLPLFNPDSFVRTCDHLRVLNAVRQIDVAMLVTSTQLHSVNLVSRLLMRKMYALAFEVSRILGTPSQQVYEEWACSCVRNSSLSDADLAARIETKLGPEFGVGFNVIAKTAYNEGRPALAIRLLQQESRLDKRVPLLLSMNELDLALSTAVASHDLDMVFFALFHAKRKLPLAAFFKLASTYPTAARAFETACREPELLRSFYYQDDRRLEIAQLDLKQAFLDLNASLQVQQDLFSKAKQVLSKSKKHTLDVQAMDNQIRLRRLQEDLENDLGRSFKGLSIVKVLLALCQMSQVNRALRVQSDFKVPEKVFWYVRMDAYINRQDYSGLYAFATSRKSPIGYEPFYRRALRAGNKRSASSFVPLCTASSATERVSMALRADDQSLAVKEAIKAKDKISLRELRGLELPTDLLAQVNQVLA